MKHDAPPSRAEPGGPEPLAERDAMGKRLAERRRSSGLSQREVARRVGVSASLISQIETGKVQPSVATLMAIARELDLSIDQILRLPASDGTPVSPRSAMRALQAGPAEPPAAVTRTTGDSVPAPRRTGRSTIVQDGADRVRIELSTGVTWERLTASPDADVDFIHVTYPPGASSSDGEQLLTHAGKEYWYILSGELVVKLVFDEHRAGPNDSFSFECTLPHQFRNDGDVPVQAVVTIVHAPAR